MSLLRLAARALSPLVAASRPRVARVLLLRPDHVGDVVLSAPAINMLQSSLPDARLTYVVGPWSSAAARNGPTVDEIHTLNFPGFTRRANANLLAPYLLLARTALSLRRTRYDMAVVLRADHWWGGLLALAAGIPIRVGGDTPETRPLLTHTCPSHADKPWGEQALDVARMAILAAGGQPVVPDRSDQFTPGEAARSTAERLWRQHDLATRSVIAVHPSAGAPLKSWPIQRWAQLADGLLDLGLGVVLVGAPDDVVLLSAIRRQMHGCAPILCGQSLETSAAIYARCELVISVDSGAGHLAAAVGARTIRLYGPAPAAVFGPWPLRAGQRVLATTALACVPCGELESPPCRARSSPACLLALQVDDVLNAVRSELGHG